MFSFFQKNKVKTTSTRTGSHGDHWYTIYSHSLSSAEVADKFIESLKNGTLHCAHEDVLIINDPSTRFILQKDEIVSGFPYFRNEKCIKLKALD